jgi:hypothetical protein
MEVIPGPKTLHEIAADYAEHPIQVGQWKGQLLEGARDLFTGVNSRAVEARGGSFTGGATPLFNQGDQSGSSLPVLSAAPLTHSRENFPGFPRMAVITKVPRHTRDLGNEAGERTTAALGAKRLVRRTSEDRDVLAGEGVDAFEGPDVGVEVPEGAGQGDGANGS